MTTNHETLIHDFVSDIMEAGQRLIDKLDAMIEESEDTEVLLESVRDDMLRKGSEHER